MGTSFEEKSVWIQLAGVGVGLLAYLVVAGRLLAGGVREMPAFAAVLALATILVVGVVVAGHVLAAVVGRREDRDERDRLIEWRAEHGSSWVLAAGVCGAVACMILGVENVWTASVLFVSLALSELMGLGLRLVYYRRGV